MTPLKILIAAATFWVAFFVTPAQAQLMCFESDSLPEFMTNYGEQLVAKGTLGQDGDRVLFLANQKTGTWTVVVDKADKGMFCPFVSGKNFHVLQPGKNKGQDIRWNQKL